MTSTPSPRRRMRPIAAIFIALFGALLLGACSSSTSGSGTPLGGGSSAASDGGGGGGGGLTSSSSSSDGGGGVASASTSSDGGGSNASSSAFCSTFSKLKSLATSGATPTGAKAKQIVAIYKQADAVAPAEIKSDMDTVVAVLDGIVNGHPDTSKIQGYVKALQNITQYAVKHCV